MCKKQKSFAWAKYYSAQSSRLAADYSNYRLLQLIKEDSEAKSIPEHIVKSIADMGAALKKTWDCSICMEIIKPDQLEITNCGHFFCKECIKEHKKRSGLDCKCPNCRRKLPVSRCPASTEEWSE